MPTATPQPYPFHSTGFWPTQKPGANFGEDEYVDVPSAFLPMLGKYHINSDPINTTVRVMTVSNSRNAGVNDVQDRLWQRTHACGYARWFWNIIKGVPFHPCDTLAYRGFIFDQPSAPYKFGTVEAARLTSHAWKQFSHFGFGSYGSSSEGPGGGVVLASTDAEYSVLCRDAVEASLPTGLASLCGDGGVYSDGRTLSGDTLCVKGHAVLMDLFYLEGPNMGSFDITPVEASASNSAGTPTGVAATIDSGGDVAYEHAWSGSDSGSGVSFTLVGLQDVTVGMMVYHQTKVGFGGVSVVTAVNGEDITLKWAFDTNPATGSTLYFGDFSMRRVSVVLPATSEDYRGLFIENNSGVSFIIGRGVERTGVNGVTIGQHGWSGNGYRTQLDEWPRDTWYKELCDLAQINVNILHAANQSSSVADQMEFASHCTNQENYLAGDPQNSYDGTTEEDWGDDTLAQSTYPGGVCHESDFTGSNEFRFACGMMDNEAHPNMIGHAETARVHLNIMSQLTTASGGGTPGINLGRLLATQLALIALEESD